MAEELSIPPSSMFVCVAAIFSPRTFGIASLSTGQGDVFNAPRL